MTTLNDFRKAKDDFFATDPESPLTPEQKRDFKGLKYFPENPALRLVLDVEEFAVQDMIQMQTTTGDLQSHMRFGVIRFMLDEQPVELTVYSDPHGYFLPFVDSLAGKETYGGGRYLEPEPAGEGMLLVDFNYAYNPYCAYNDLFSCPLTPWENHLKVPIRAGEKAFHT